MTFLKAVLKKLKDFLLETLFAPSGTALLVLSIMALLSLFNLINSTLFFSGNGWMLLMLPIAFGVPFYFFWLSRGGKKYLPTIHFELPKKVHIPVIVLSTLFIFLGSVLIKLLVLEGRYTEFPLYNMFFAHRNGKLWNDLYLVLTFCILVPILEGIVFRGAIVKEHDKQGRLVTTVFSSLTFALLGFSFEALLPRFFLGALLCILLYATESITLTVAVHVAYNFFAVFFEPMLISVKTVSSSYALFVFLIAIVTLVVAIFLFSHLSRLYKKYSHDKFGTSFVKSMPLEKSFWNLAYLCTSIPAIASIILFVIVTLIIEI